MDTEPVTRLTCLTTTCRNDPSSRGLCKTCLATFYRVRTPAIEQEMISTHRILPAGKRGRKPGPLANSMKTTTTPEYLWAKREQGYTGSFAEWQALDPDTRREYELGAAGIGTN